MTDPKCSACGHVNRVGAAVCETCDARLGEPAPAAEDFRAAGESSAPFEDAAGGFGASAGGFEPADATAADIPAPPFRGMGDVVSPTLEVYRKNFVLVGILVAVATLPAALLQYGVMLAMADSPVEVADGRLLTAATLTWVLTGALSLAGSALLSGALVYAVIDIQRTGAASAGECLRRGLRVLPKVFVVTLLYTVVTTAGYLLLIIPGVIFSLMYAVAVPVAVAERRGPFESLKRSARLTEGYRGLIFLTHFLWGILIIALSMVVTWSFVFGEAEDGLVVLLVQSLINGMLSASAIVLDVYIYLGLLRERSEGFAPSAYAPAAAR